MLNSISLSNLPYLAGRAGLSRARDRCFQRPRAALVRTTCLVLGTSSHPEHFCDGLIGIAAITATAASPRPPASRVSRLWSRRASPLRGQPEAPPAPTRWARAGHVRRERLTSGGRQKCQQVTKSRRQRFGLMPISPLRPIVKPNTLNDNQQGQTRHYCCLRVS